MIKDNYVLPKKISYVKDNKVYAKFVTAPKIDEIISKEFSKMSHRFLILYLTRYENNTNPCFESSATCLDTDNFNAQIGTDIATGKCDFKVHYAVANTCANIIKELGIIIDHLEDIKLKHEKKMVNIIEYNERIGGDYAGN